VCALDLQGHDSEPLLISVTANKVSETVNFINKPPFSSANWLVNKFKSTTKSLHRSEHCRARTRPDRLINHPAHYSNMCQHSGNKRRPITRNFAVRVVTTTAQCNNMQKTGLEMSLVFNRLNHEWNSVLRSTFTPH
jgi:hypothetical protein